MKKKLLLLVLAATAAMTTWRWTRDDAPAVATHEKVVLDRLWIDHLPRSERDMFQLFVALTEEPFGVFQQLSQWKGSYELFRYEAHGDQLRLHYPQTGQREQAKAVARKCNEGPFDYCLELSGATRGVKKYYSREDWVVGDVRTVRELEHRVEQWVASLTTTPPAE